MNFRPGDIVALFGEVTQADGHLKIRPIDARIEDGSILADPANTRLIRRAIYIGDKVVYNGRHYEMEHVLQTNIAIIKKDGAHPDDVNGYSLANIQDIDHADRSGLEQLVSAEKAALINRSPAAAPSLPAPAPTPAETAAAPVTATPAPAAAPAQAPQAAYSPQHRAAPAATSQAYVQPAPAQTQVTSTEPASPAPQVVHSDGPRSTPTSMASVTHAAAAETNEDVAIQEDATPPMPAVPLPPSADSRADHSFGDFQIDDGNAAPRQADPEEPQKPVMPRMSRVLGAAFGG